MLLAAGAEEYNDGPGNLVGGGVVTPSPFMIIHIDPFRKILDVCHCFPLKRNSIPHEFKEESNGVTWD